MSQHSSNQQGFTIIELMIATALFSVILVSTTIILVSISNLYYKGVNQTRVQANVRSIADDITQHLQLTSTVTSATALGEKAYCIGGTRYSILLGKKLGDPGVSHVMWRDQFSGTCTPLALSTITSTTAGDEMVNANTRITQLDVSLTSPYTLNLGMAYGDDDVLTALMGPGVRCNPGEGRQFCAASYLNTTVVERLY